MDITLLGTHQDAPVFMFKLIELCHWHHATAALPWKMHITLCQKSFLLEAMGRVKHTLPPHRSSLTDFLAVRCQTCVVPDIMEQCVLHSSLFTLLSFCLFHLLTKSGWKRENLGPKRATNCARGGAESGYQKTVKIALGSWHRQKAALEKFLTTAPLFCLANALQPGKSLSQAQMHASSVGDVVESGWECCCSSPLCCSWQLCSVNGAWYTLQQARLLS